MIIGIFFRALVAHWLEIGRNQAGVSVIERTWYRNISQRSIDSCGPLYKHGWYRGYEMVKPLHQLFFDMIIHPYSTVNDDWDCLQNFGCFVLGQFDSGIDHCRGSCLQLSSSLKITVSRNCHHHWRQLSVEILIIIDKNSRQYLLSSLRITVSRNSYHHWRLRIQTWFNQHKMYQELLDNVNTVYMK